MRTTLESLRISEIMLDSYGKSLDNMTKAVHGKPVEQLIVNNQFMDYFRLLKSEGMLKDTPGCCYTDIFTLGYIVCPECGEHTLKLTKQSASTLDCLPLPLIPMELR